MKTWKGVVKRYRESPKEIQAYFVHLPKLVDDFPWDVSLAYVFSRVELAHNMAIYCSTVKLHRADASLAKTAVQGHHMTREGFLTTLETVCGKKPPPGVMQKLEEAEEARDKVMHGKDVSDAEMRKAIVRVIEYAEGLNAFLNVQAGLQPFDHLRGFKGRAKSLDKGTTRWLLKGMGFTLG